MSSGPAVWRQLPSLLVTVMSASLLLGEHLPPFRKLWSISRSHVTMISVMSFGQFAVGGILVWFLLAPVFGINRKAGALLEMSFNGGHGTVAGLAPVLQQYGVGDLVPVGLGLATIGIVSGIVVGTTLVNYAIRSPSIPVVRQTPPPGQPDQLGKRLGAVNVVERPSQRECRRPTATAQIGQLCAHPRRVAIGPHGRA